MDVSTKTTKDSTRRLAVCNLDWDRVTATDLFGKLHTRVSLPLFLLLDWDSETGLQVQVIIMPEQIEQMTYFVAAVLINLVF